MEKAQHPGRPGTASKVRRGKLERGSRGNAPTGGEDRGGEEGNGRMRRTGSAPAKRWCSGFPGPSPGKGGSGGYRATRAAGDKSPEGRDPRPRRAEPGSRPALASAPPHRCTWRGLPGRARAVRGPSLCQVRSRQLPSPVLCLPSFTLSLHLLALFPAASKELSPLSCPRRPFWPNPSHLSGLHPLDE